MTKDSEIVLVEATEIMRSLPTEMQHDEQIMDSVIVSLQSGISKVEARQDALEIAQIKLQQTVEHGFKLVSNEITTIKHEAEKDRIHASYAQKAAENAKAIAEKAWERCQELATGVAKAEAKADGARDLAKNSRWANFDPLTGMAVCAVGIVGCLLLVGMNIRVSAQGEDPNRSVIRCGKDVNCTYQAPPIQPMPAQGGI
jgi:hypothetical protein